MEKERLELKLPMEAGVLRHAGNMLLSLADELGDPVIGGKAPDVVVNSQEALDTSGAAGGDLDAGTTGGGAPLNVVVDEAGLPWDGRINPDSKEKLKSGARKDCWKYKRKLDAAYIVEVEAELKAAMLVPSPGPTADTKDNDAPPPPAPEGEVALDFPGIIQKVTALQNEQRISPDQIAAISVSVGLASFMLLGTRVDLIPAFNVELDKLCPEPTQ